MRRFLPLTAAVAALLLPSLLPAQDWTRIHQVDGAAAGDQFGYSIVGLDDVDGNGVADMAVGAPTVDTFTGVNSGAVYVVAGEDGSIIYWLPGQSADDLLGFALANLGDLDGDSIDELAVGSPYYSGGALLFNGRVFILSGFDGTLLDTLTGSATGELFGSSITAVDVEPGGFRELIVGSPGGSAAAGEVRIYRWNDTAMDMEFAEVLVGDTASDFFGYALAPTSNIDPNPGREFLVSAPYAMGGAGDAFVEAGKVYLYGGGLSLSGLPNRIRTFSMDAANAHLGVSLTGGRDVSGDIDGKADLAAGAPDYMDSRGAVLIWRGEDGTFFEQIDGADAGDQFGYSIRLLQDLDEDGLAELAVGSPRANEFDGMAQVFDLMTPPLSGAVATLTVNGEPGSRMGSMVDQVGDLNLDGANDVAFGAPRFRGSAGSRQGRVETWVAIKPIRIDFQGLATAGEDAMVHARNLQPGSTARFWVSNTDSPEPVGTGQNFSTVVPVDASGEADVILPGSATGLIGAGNPAYVQVEEEFNALFRNSDIDSRVLLAPIDLTILTDPVISGDPADLEATGLIPGSTARFFVVVNDPDPVANGVVFETVVGVDGSGVATAQLSGGSTSAAGAGSTLVFQVEEQSAPTVTGVDNFRYSDIESAVVQDNTPDDLNLLVQGAWTVGSSNNIVAVDNATPGHTVIFYGSIALPSGTPDQPIPGIAGGLWNLKAPSKQIGVNRVANAAGVANIGPFTLPATVPGSSVSLCNRRIYIQAASADSLSTPTVIRISQVQFRDTGACP